MSHQDPPRLNVPHIQLEVVEDVSPPGQTGFLRLVRRRLRAHYPDGTASRVFVYDEVDRDAIDAAVIAAHFQRGGEAWVYLRSCVRPPVALRDPKRSPVEETEHRPGLWELPAGLVEAHEQSPDGPRRCAQRELYEELGFEAELSMLRELGPSMFPAPGFVAERHFYFEVEVDPSLRREPKLDGSALEHFGRVWDLPLAQALRLCEQGFIQDAKTELALRRLRDRRA